MTIDFGRELYIPWQMTEGKVLYRDIAYFNGPPLTLRHLCLVSPVWSQHVTDFRRHQIRHPGHIMWETGFWESMKASILDLFTNKDERAGADWLQKLRGRRY